jgi:hypothetical protein
MSKATKNADAGGNWRAEQWVPYMLRGISGEGPLGTESSGEYLIVEAAGTLLPSGEPVLTLFHRFWTEEMGDLQRALDVVGINTWRYALKHRLAPAKQEPDPAWQERRLVLALLAGTQTADTIAGSTSQVIAALLAVGRFEALPEPYANKTEAWDRLNAAQQALVREFNPYFRGEAWHRPIRYG